MHIETMDFLIWPYLERHSRKTADRILFELQRDTQLQFFSIGKGGEVGIQVFSSESQVN